MLMIFQLTMFSHSSFWSSWPLTALLSKDYFTDWCFNQWQMFFFRSLPLCTKMLEPPSRRFKDLSWTLNRLLAETLELASTRPLGLSRLTVFLKDVSCELESMTLRFLLLTLAIFWFKILVGASTSKCLLPLPLGPTGPSLPLLPSRTSVFGTSTNGR